jgi:hypothetical protein
VAFRYLDSFEVGYDATLPQLSVAYYTQERLNQLGTIDGVLDAPTLPDPEREYRSARTTRGRPRGDDLLHEQTYLPRPGVQLFPPFVPDFSGDQHTVSSTGGPPSILRTSSERETPRSIAHAGRQRRAGRDEGARILAPLIYLQNASAPPRPPVDDFAIRALDSYIGSS